MGLRLTKVTGSREKREFLAVPERLHRDHASWFAPLRADERGLFDERRNPALRYCDHVLWLVREESGEVVGRVAGIINRRYNELRGERTARFSHLEFIDDVEVARVLLDAVVEWARGAGMEQVVGPMGFTDQDPEGFLIEGFAELPAIATYQNLEHVPRLLEALGWTKYADYVVYNIPVNHETPAVYRKALGRIASRQGLRLAEFQRRRELKPLVKPILGLMNETYAELTGYSFLDEEEIQVLAQRYMPVIDPRFVKVVFAGETLVGFIIAMPDLSDGFRRARGHLLPLGWLWILRAGKRARRLDLLLGGIKEGYRTRGVDALLGTAMIRSAREAGFEYMDSHHELETNTRVRAEMERNGGRVYKRFRLFQRPI